MKCVSLSRAAEILGVCVRTVRREIERRKLIAFHGLVLLAETRVLVHQSLRLSEKVQKWQMVRDAGFEPATSCV
jgi:hypothetical protein